MSITRLLVANRGEVARRVFRTCREMGIETVAVFSDADRMAPFVAEADRAVSLGGDAPAESYLRGVAVVEAARRAGADAVHPGYGFLAEDAGFAEQVLEAGLVWVGPSPRAMSLMGDKLAAKEIMIGAGVPVLASVLPAGASEIGFPLMVKAAAGGGGRGMRIVRSPGELASEVAGARREAEAAFGDGTVFLERLVQEPRHIEVQIIADTHGLTRALFERECSIQRRHQKILEEAPSPFVDEALRRQLSEAAVAASRAVDYVGAGTVEFIVAADGSFWFLEMNTRLQVEHPVTEAITGLDLVELQLHVAGGAALGFGQSEVTFTGHSIEARINAEDPADGFSPRAGPVRHVRVPKGVRWDSAVEPGSAITPYYDPLVAKLVVSRSERAAALDAMSDALDGLVLGPVPTNAGFLRWLVNTPLLRGGEMTTNVIDSLASAEMPAPASSSDAAGVAAAAWLASVQRERTCLDSGPWAALGPFRLTDHRTLAAVLLRDAAGDLYEVPATTILGADVNAVVASSTDADSVAVNLDGHTVTFDVPDRSDAWAPTATDDTGSADAVAAPFPAVVVEVAVVPGDVVATGDTVVVVEAMKMLHSLTAHGTGTVAEVRCAPGDAVEANQVLVSFEQH